jgi:hypothetical protein
LCFSLLLPFFETVNILESLNSCLCCGLYHCVEINIDTSYILIIAMTPL